jgi:cytochrome c553
MKSTLMLGLGAFLLGVYFAAAQTSRSTSNGVFTTEQAKNGERAYQARCASCHGSDLHSTDPEAPDLTEEIFKFGWKEKSLAEIFEQIRSTMPQNNPRSLDDQTYIDILAYILQSNGAPAGNQKLEPNPAVLRQIVVEPPH